VREPFNQPNPNDVVLGGHEAVSSEAVPTEALVLGGFVGVKQRLDSSIADQRVTALSEAMQHGIRGVNLVVRALRDESAEVRHIAYALLHDRPEPRIQQAIARYYVQEYYAQLNTALAQGQWQTADQETKLALFKLSGLSLREQCRPEHLSNLSCRDLQTIDRLWLKHSRGRFGFSVQRSIWQHYHNLYWSKSDVWVGFADRVGWRVHNLIVQNHWKRYPEIVFSLDAPAGHLPFMGDTFGIFTIEAIAKRLEQCKVEV
jgi:GUN4-like